AEHGRLARDPAPPRGNLAGRRAAQVRGAAVAREPERGLPDRPPPRAGPDRQGGSELDLEAPAVRTARALRERRRGPGAVLASCVDDLPALPPRDPAPDVVGGQREADGAHAAREQAERPRHAHIIAEIA